MTDEKVYPVSADVATRAHITNEQYLAMYDASLNRPDKFWTEKANEFVSWHKHWEKLTESDFAKGEAKWFIGAQLNVSYNCIDRHLGTRGNQDAIIWEGDDPSVDAHITYNELHDHVCRLANVLKQRALI